MTIIKLMGGLGNQLQQYALYEQMKAKGMDVAIDASWYEEHKCDGKILAPRELELNYLDGIEFRKATPKELQKVAGPENALGRLYRKLFPSLSHRFYEFDMYHPEIFNQENLFLVGYWAAEKYYADILPMLREKVTFPNPSSANQALAKKITEDAYAVSIHLRRGDYLSPGNQEMFGGICTEAYYEGAIAYIESLHPDAHFYIFSDDPDYGKAAYAASKFTHVDINHDAENFYDIWLMSQCNAHICANSTFSFWGARLNPKEDKIMLRPSIHKNTQEFIPEQMHDLWPGWILLDKEGNVV